MESIQDRFRSDVRRALAKKEKRGAMFLAGMPHNVFIGKGVPARPYRVSPAVIRKARKSKYNGHSVKQEDLERLPELLDNPAAVLKSMTTPKAFVVVLDAKDDHELPVITSIEPRNGFNEITSIYGRENFIDFARRNIASNAVLSINKNKVIEGVDLATIQSRGGATFDDFQEPAYQTLKNVSSAQFALKAARAFNRANNILGGSNMTQDEMEAGQTPAQNEMAGQTPAQTKNREFVPGTSNHAADEQAFRAAITQRDTVLKALKSGTLACLPREDGFADTSPAVNLTTGTVYHGTSLLQLKEHAHENGFPTTEYVTKNVMLQSSIPRRENDKANGISISFSENKNGKWEETTTKLYNISQCAEPEKLKEWIDSKRPPIGDIKQREAPTVPIVCSSTEPEQYLGQYFAAVSTGAKFKASPEQAAEFSKKFEAEIEMKAPEKKMANPFNLHKICNKASAECKKVVSEYYASQRHEQRQ